MTLKRIAVMGAIFIFFVSFLFNKIYSWYPSVITFMLFPTNDSVWEYQKVIWLAYLVWGLIQFSILKLFNLYSRNIIPSIVLGAVFNVFIFLLLYIPLILSFGESYFLTVTIYLLSVIISQGYSHSILNSDAYYPKLNFICFCLIPVIWAILIYLSFKPFV